jgi:hypothetical protein
VIAQPVVVEEDARDDQRPREASAAGLVDARDEPQAELPVEVEEAPSSVLRA